jgi:hypothetical protein
MLYEKPYQVFSGLSGSRFKVKQCQARNSQGAIKNPATLVTSPIGCLWQLAKGSQKKTET